MERMREMNEALLLSSIRQHELTELAERAVRELSEQDRRKDEFVSILAHELRNPLAPLMNGLQLLSMTPVTPEVLEQTRAMMARQLAQMVRLVDDLMDVSRITRGKVELQRTRVAMASVVKQAIETSWPLIDASRNTLTVHVPDTPIFVEGDATRLAQILSNLLNNAAKFSEPDGHITISVEAHGSEASIRVRDTGIGIAAPMLSRVFELFTQAEHTLDKAQGGLGIGLSLVRAFVGLHGGRVEVASDGPGRGSVFTVWLPIAPAGAGQPEPGAQATGSPQTAHRRIVVADDNSDAVATLCLLLQRLGHDARAARDGAEAVELAETFRPELMLLDLGMPRMNGYDACRRIREQPWGEAITLIALTGWGQEDDRQRTRDVGFDDHLVKPVDGAALQRVFAHMPLANPNDVTRSR